MAASYPTSAKSFTTKNTSDVIQAAHVNDAQDEITAIETDLVNGVARLRLGTNSVTLASDAFTATKSQYTVDTEGAAASDNLSTITAGSGIGAGAILILKPASAARVVTVKDTTGNILLLGGDYVMNSAKAVLSLLYDGTNWVEIARALIAPTVGAITFLGGASGTDTTASATNVFTLAIAGLTAKDRLRIEITHSSAAQLTNAPVLYSTTDSAAIKGLCNNGNLAAADYCYDCVTLSNDQSSTTKVVAHDAGFVGTGAAAGHNTGIVWTPATAWTGSWTLALRTGVGGVVAGGTYRYSIAVLKVAGQ